MDADKSIRLQYESLDGEAAEDALPIVTRAFNEIRRQVIDSMCAADPRSVEADRARRDVITLAVMGQIEGRLKSYIQNGDIARKELRGNVQS